MQNIFHKIYRDPQKVIALPTSKKTNIIPFEYNYDLFAEYYWKANEVQSRHNIENMTWKEQEQMSASAIGFIDDYEMPEEFQEAFREARAAGKLDYTIDEDVMAQIHFQNDPSNPKFRPAQKDKDLEIAIFHCLMVFNEFYGQYNIEENELYYIFKECLANNTDAIAGPVYRFAASIIYNELQGNDHIALTDWSMLPALMLLLPALKQDTKVSLPPQNIKLMGDDAYQLLIQFFNQEIPRITWLEFNGTLFPKDSLVLSTFPTGFYEYFPNKLQKISDIKGGFFYSSWNFLARDRHEAVRRELYKTNTIRAIIQLPKLLRSGTKNYGAGIILTGNNHTQTTIRMGYMPPSYKEGEDSLDLPMAMNLVNCEEEIAKHSLTVKQETISKTQDLRLSPSYYLAEIEHVSTGKNLGQYADILFYHKPRKKDCDALTDKGDKRCVQEISLNDIDTSSSFVFAEEKKYTLVDMPPTQHKYLVQPNDILFAYKGSFASLGKSGFVVKVEGDTLSNQSTCIIRAREERITVWLYYQLKSPKTQDWIRAHSSGTTSLVISLETLKNLPLEPYNATLTNEIEGYHQEMIEYYNKIQEFKRRLRYCRDNILEVQKKHDKKNQHTNKTGN